MTHPSPLEIAETYLATWNEADDTSRQAAIARNWSASARYADPIMSGDGRDGIAAMISAARAQFPGHGFALRGAPDGHGSWVRFSWDLAPENGAPVAGGTDIRCAQYATFGTQALSDNALVALKDRKACLLGQHGQISLGKTMEAALWLAIEVESLSRMYVQALTLGEPPVLPDEEMARVLEQMRRMSYGLGPEAEGSNDVPRQRAAQ